eukprot:TRINITY_DN64645_c0_g1_i1.p1 TRINITY_DN64645_c0_g1~~TRINITY_DN64645_c0_g1_i1.p1  ORF type:complete len:159 (+),score=13.10 TRINITY_DN64645_c0_g1_i1:94-570(+)
MCIRDSSSAAHHHHKSSAPLLQHQSDEDGNATDDGEGFGFSSSTTPQAPLAPPHITQGEIASMRSTVELCRVIGRHQTYVDDLQDSLAAYETARESWRSSTYVWCLPITRHSSTVERIEAISPCVIWGGARGAWGVVELEKPNPSPSSVAFPSSSLWC